MTRDNTTPKAGPASAESEAHTGEVLPPESRSVASQQPYAPNRSFVISAIERIRNHIITKEIDSFTAKVQSWNAAVAAMRDSNRMVEEYEASLVRVKNLPMLRHAAEAKVLDEIKQIFDDAEDRQLEREVRRTRLQADLIRAKRDLEDLEKPSGKAAEQPRESRGKRRVEEIQRIRKERDEMIALILDGRNVEEHTEEDRQLIEDIRLMAEDQIKRFLEEDRD